MLRLDKQCLKRPSLRKIIREVTVKKMVILEEL